MIPRRKYQKVKNAFKIKKKRLDKYWLSVAKQMYMDFNGRKN